MKNLMNFIIKLLCTNLIIIKIKSTAIIFGLFFFSLNRFDFKSYSRILIKGFSILGLANVSGQFYKTFVNIVAFFGRRFNERNIKRIGYIFYLLPKANPSSKGTFLLSIKSFLLPISSLQTSAEAYLFINHQV